MDTPVRSVDAQALFDFSLITYKCSCHGIWTTINPAQFPIEQFLQEKCSKPTPRLIYKHSLPVTVCPTLAKSSTSYGNMFPLSQAGSSGP
jgi:hypothetical protein